MQDTPRTAINLILSALALVAFMWLFGGELRKAWKGEVKPTDPINDRVAYAATAVAGVVAAIVAAALALPLPNPPVSLDGRAPNHSIVARMSAAVGGPAPTAESWKRLLAMAYIVVYVVVWIRYDASSLIKAQALTFLGLILAAAKASVP